MTMKKILMAAVAVSAITASAANALTISALSTIGSAGTTLTPTAVAGVPVYEAYTLANEITAPATVSVPAKIATLFSAVLGTNKDYIVTYTLTNGTFTDTTAMVASDQTVATSVANALAGTGIGATALTSSTGTITTTSAQYIVSTTSATTALAVAADLRGIKPTSARLPVSVTVSLALASAPTVNLDGGTSTATIIDFRDGLSLKATAVPQKLTIGDDFKKFANGGGTTLTSANIATDLGVALAAPVISNNTADKVYKDAAANQISGTELTSTVLTISGDFSKLNGRLGSAQLADTGTANVFTVDAASANRTDFRNGAATFALAQKTPTALAGAESTYSLTASGTVMASGFTAPAFTSKTLGAVSLEGISFLAPWVAGPGQTNFATNIRISNSGDQAGKVTATIRTPDSTAVSNGATTCVLATSIPANGELVITSASLATCFGSFKRADILVTIQSSSTNLTAKMRNTYPAGVAQEISLGAGTFNQ